MNVNVFTQDLKEVFTILQEIKVVEKYVKQLIEKVGNVTDSTQEIIEYYNNIKDYVVQNENTTEIGGNLDVDGNITINSAKNIIIKDGSELNSKLYKHVSILENTAGYGVFQLSYYSTSETETWLEYITKLFNACKKIGSSGKGIVELLPFYNLVDTNVYPSYLLKFDAGNYEIEFVYYNHDEYIYTDISTKSITNLYEMFNEKKHYVVQL